VETLWLYALVRSPDGPTLFSTHTCPLSPSDTLRYLFRAFDTQSSGTNNDTIVASVACNAGELEYSKKDLLLMNPEQACKALLVHLNKNCFGEGDPTDNLMSWSSSLLFII